MTESSTTPVRRALVLGGGAAAGNAWEIGVVAGLADAGLDVTTSDLVVGTSAGATAGAMLTARPPAELYAAVLDAPSPAARLGPRPSGPLSAHLARMDGIIASAADPADMRRRMGAAALALDADPGASARWRAIVAARLPSPDWPATRLLVTAIDAETGDPVVFDRDSGVALVDAVAASTSNGFGVPPYRIGDRRYLDGGYRRNENADLAAGCDRVLVLSPFGGRTRHPLGWGMQLAAQADELRAAGSRVETVGPGADAAAAFGDTVDPALRPQAARVGFAQGRALAPSLAELWR